MYLVKPTSLLMSTLLFSAQMLPTVFLLTTRRSKPVAFTRTGTFFLLRKSRIPRPRSPKTGMTRSTSLTQKTRSQRVMMTSQRRFLTQMLRSLRIGMMRKMVSGLPQPFQTLSTRVHGSQRKLRTPTTRASGRHP
uniref:Uncharacterized protein n=1 Tax=Opuntia streptacantha TaxID=393608 RepID=A0A7C9D783_OPUST